MKRGLPPWRERKEGKQPTLPIKPKAQDPQTLVVVRPAKNILEHGAHVRRRLLRREAKDRHAAQGREDVARDGLPEGRPREGPAEDGEAVLVLEGVVVEGLVDGELWELGPVHLQGT